VRKRWDAATVGEIYVDHVFTGLASWPNPGEEVFAQNYLREVGGGAAITACGLALLGRRTAAFGVIGGGEAPWIEERLRSFGVETAELERAEGSSGVTVSISVGGERTFFSHRGSNALLSEYLLRPEIAEELEQAEHVHFAVPLERHVAEALLPRLRAAGSTTSLDVGWQPEWYQEAANLQTCRDVDYFLPNGKEAEYLTEERQPEDVLTALEQRGFAHVVVKLGAEGAAIRTQGQVMRAPSLKVKVVDTTGAGDAFDAGLIDAILDKADAAEMLRRATVCGALSTRVAGALMGLARRQELEEIYG
jgi:sugar/nucleoside kinase (ribokinase family)